MVELVTCVLPSLRVSTAMHVLNFAIAFAFEHRLTGGNSHHREIIVITSESISAYVSGFAQFSPRALW